MMYIKTHGKNYTCKYSYNYSLFIQCTEFRVALCRSNKRLRRPVLEDIWNSFEQQHDSKLLRNGCFTNKYFVDKKKLIIPYYMKQMQLA